MKIRQGFVSNSSSSSFIIPQQYVTDHQLEQMKLKGDEEGWVVYETTLENMDELAAPVDVVRGSTDMDNFDMIWYMNEIGVDTKFLTIDD